MKVDHIADRHAQKDGGFEVLADIPGVDKSSIKCAAETHPLIVAVAAARGCRLSARVLELRN